MPAIIIRTELMAVSVVPDIPAAPAPLPAATLPAMPKLKISSRAPKITPLMPASESIRLIASCGNV